MKTKILFLDWYGTLSAELFWPKIKKDDPKLSKRIEDVLFNYPSELIKQWMLGIVSTETVCDIIAKHDASTSEMLFDALVESCTGMHVDQNIIEMVQELRDDYHIVLVTDNMDCFSRFTVPQTGITEWTDAIFNSSDLKRFKTDEQGKTFLDAARDLHVPFHQTICIDDSSMTCDVVRSLGGIAIQTTGVERTLEILKGMRCYTG